MGFAFQRTATPIIEPPGGHASPEAHEAHDDPPGPPGAVEPRRACDWLLAWYDRHRFFYLGLLLLFYLAGFNGIWRPEPDSALYLSIGRNLAEGRGYTYNGLPHALAYPGMPYLHALIFKVTGLPGEGPALLVMLVMSLLVLGLMYRLFLLHTDRANAVVLTCMAGMTYTLYHYAFELRNDIPFMLGVLAFLVGCEAWRQAREAQPRHFPRWWDTALLVGGLGLAVVMRPHMWVLLLATLGTLVIAAIRSPRRGGLVAGMLGVTCAGGLLLMIDPRRAAHLGNTYEGSVMQGLAELLNLDGLRHLAWRAYHLVSRDVVEAAFGHELGPGLSLVAGAALVWLSVRLGRRRALWGLFVAGTLLMILLAPVSMPRYLLPILPLMALAWWSAMVRVNRRLPGRWGNVAFVLMLVVWVVPNFLRISKTVAEQRHPPLERSYAMNQALHTLAGEIRRHVESDAPVLAHQRVARVLEYWSQRRVSAVYEMSRSWVPQYVVWPADTEVLSRLAEQHLEAGDVVAAVGSADYPETHWMLRRVHPAALPEAAASPEPATPRSAP